MAGFRQHIAARSFEFRRTRLLWACVAVVACTGGLFLVADQFRKGQPNAITHSEYGESLFASGKYVRAAETLRASYRLEPTAGKRQQLMTALYAIGDYNGVLDAGHGDDGRPSMLLKAEALLALQRLSEAKALALNLLAADRNDSEAAFIVARSAYGLGQIQAADDRLKEVLQSATDIRGEAWLFRARMALDENTFAVARSASDRALEAGVHFSRTEPIAIEILIRKGLLAEADVALKQRYARINQDNDSRRVRFDLQGLALQAHMHLANGDAVEAARVYSSIEPWFKHQIRGPLKLATVNWYAGDHAQAAATLDEYRIAAPNDWVGLDLMASFFASIGDIEKSLDIIDDLSIEAPALGTLRRINVERSARRFDDAFKTLQGASLLMAADQLAAEQRPTALRFLFGRDKEADFTLTRYDAFGSYLRPTIADLEKIDRQASDLVEFDAGEAAFKSDPVAMVLRGRAHLWASEVDQAIRHFDQALSIAPNFYQALTYRTVADVYANDLAAAEERLVVLLKEDPGALSSRMLLARVYRAFDQKSASIDILKNYELALLETAEFALFYGRLLDETGADAQLIGFSDLARQISPEASFTAELVELSGRLSEAVKSYRRALFAAPKDGLRIRNYGRVMEMLGREREAVSLLDRLVRRNPDAEYAVAEMVRLQSKIWDRPVGDAAPEKSAQSDNGQGSQFDLAVGGHARSELKPAVSEASEAHFWNNPENGDAIFRYAAWKALKGEDARVLFRISCFWGDSNACREANESDS